MARVLLVEDESSLREVVAEALAELDHEVTAAENGLVALQRLATDDFDVVISDISMPEGVSGIDVARQVQSHHPRTQVILVSGTRLAQLPALPDNVTFVPKPYRIQELLALLH